MSTWPYDQVIGIALCAATLFSKRLTGMGFFRAS